MNVPINMTIGFLGDQGLSDNARKVLQMLKHENVDLILHAGDITYEDIQANKWVGMIRENTGNIPYLAVVGNHDNGIQIFLFLFLGELSWICPRNNSQAKHPLAGNFPLRDKQFSHSPMS